MAATWVTPEQGRAAVAPALVGADDAPADPGVLAPLIAAAAGPAYGVLAALADPSELEHLRHVALRLTLHRPPRPEERLRVTTEEGPRGRLGAATGVILASRMEAEGGAEVAVSEGWAQLGPSTALPADADPLPVPRAVRVTAPEVELAEEVPEAAVAAWLALTGDEVPIHRADHALAVELGGAAVPGALLAVRVVHRLEPLLGAAPTGLEVRFKRLVPAEAPLRVRVEGRRGPELRVAVVDGDGVALASGRLSA